MIEVNSHGLREILNQLMLECDLDDAKLSRQTGVPASTISRLRLSSSANPTAASLRPLAKFFEISISQLLGDEPLPNHLNGPAPSFSNTTRMLPVIDWTWIGEWLPGDGVSETKKTEMPSQWISTEREMSEKSFAVQIPTERFGLFLRKGSVILVDPLKAHRDGDLVLVKTPQENIISLRQILMEGQAYYLRSVNPEIKGTLPLKEPFEIFGVVVETRFQLLEEKQKAESGKTANAPFFKKLSSVEISLN